MKNTILKKLNNLNSRDFMMNFPGKNEDLYTIALFNEDLIIKFASVSGKPELINFTFEKYKAIPKQEISVTFEQEELQPFLKLVRKSVASKFFMENCNEDKREELINLMKQATNKSLIKKEDLVIVDGNEEKKYYFSHKDLYKEVSVKELSNLSFYNFSIMEVIKDKRLKDTGGDVKQYEILISNKEFCEIFNFDIEKETQLRFENAFSTMFPDIEKVTSNIKNMSAKKKEEEQLTAEQTVNSKIKNIL